MHGGFCKPKVSAIAAHTRLAGGTDTVNKTLSKLAAVTLTCAAATSSQAATLTFTGWTYGNGNSVSVTTPSFSGQGGGLHGTLSGASALNGAIDTYCVELTQSIGFNTPYSDYTLVDAAAHSGFTQAKVDKLGRLLSFANAAISSAGGGLKDDYSTSLQLAIWNIVYDNDDSLSVQSGGTFSDTSGFAAKANDFLNGAISATNTLQLWVLESREHQDQLVWRTRQDVPEPASLALALTALGGLGWSSKRRQRSAG